MLENAEHGTVFFSQKVPKITCLEGQCFQAIKLCSPDTTLKDNNCIVMASATLEMEPKKTILRIPVCW